MSKRHPKRKTRKDRFARLPLKVLAHSAVTTLSHAEFRVLTLLAAQYHGYNNGALGITADQAKRQNIGSNNTLYRALRTLEERGLIEMTYPASRTPPRPTMYALTWESVDDTEWSMARRVPSRDYESWTPETKPDSQNRKQFLRVVNQN